MNFICFKRHVFKFDLYVGPMETMTLYCKLNIFYFLKLTKLNDCTNHLIEIVFMINLKSAYDKFFEF